MKSGVHRAWLVITPLVAFLLLFLIHQKNFYIRSLVKTTDLSTILCGKICLLQIQLFLMENLWMLFLFQQMIWIALLEVGTMWYVYLRLLQPEFYWILLLVSPDIISLLYHHLSFFLIFVMINYIPFLFRYLALNLAI